MPHSLWVDIREPWDARFDRVQEALYEGRHKFIHPSDGQHELSAEDREKLRAMGYIE